QEYPELRVELQERPSDVIVKALVGGATDIGLFDARAAGAAAIESHPYYRDELMLLVHAGHRLASFDALWFDEALGEDFVSQRAGTALHAVTAAHARRAGCTLKIRIHVHGFDSMCQMVAAGIG